MSKPLFHLRRAPDQLPSWETILNDLGQPSAVQIARTLDVGPSTVFRWNQRGSAPRAACLALFWLTRWGHSLIHTEATNDAIRWANMAGILDHHRQDQAAAVAQLTQERDRLQALVAHFAALAQGMEPAKGHGPAGGLAQGLDPSQTETLRKVLLAPSAQRPTGPGPDARHLPNAEAAPAPAARPASGRTAGTLASWASYPLPGHWTAPNHPQPEQSGGRGHPAQLVPSGAHAANSPASPDQLPEGVLTWPGAASAAPQHRPQAASLGANPQPPTPKAFDETTSQTVFSSIVRSTVNPTSSRRTRRARQAANNSQQEPTP